MRQGPIAIILIVIGLGLLLIVNRLSKEQKNQSSLVGQVEADGSSTVLPITEAVAEEFNNLHPKVQVNVGVSGTGGGFKRFVNGEIDIANASRPIKASEAESSKAKNIDYQEFKVALDGIAIVVNKDNDFVDCLTTAELKNVWNAGSQVTKWRQIRAEWPDEPIKLYGPGTDSGTFDYFTETINGKEDSSRADYTASEDDSVLVVGVAGDKFALGYFGYAYYAENTDRLKVVAVDQGQGCVTPTSATIESGEYKPLSRPLFIYVKQESLKRAELSAFVRFYLEKAAELVKEVGYVPLSKSIYEEQLSGLK